MFSRSIVRLQSLVVLCLFCQVFTASECYAQQSEKSLFVIKAPSVAKSGYGKQPSAIKFAPIARQTQESTPREDTVAEELPDPPDPGANDDPDLDDLAPEEDIDLGDDDLLRDEEGEDDVPPTRPMTEWNLKPMSSISPALRRSNEQSPADQSWQLTNRNSLPIANSEKVFAWAAPDITYKPLYFEDVALERYGQTKGLYRQTIASSIHYLKSATLLPYHSLYDPVNSCDGPLGYCRPGERVNCVSQKHYFGNPWCCRK